MKWLIHYKTFNGDGNVSIGGMSRKITEKKIEEAKALAALQVSKTHHVDIKPSDVIIKNIMPLS